MSGAVPAVDLLLDMLRAGVDDFESSILKIDEAPHEWDPETLAVLLVNLNEQIQTLKMAQSVIESLLAKKMREDLMVVPGATLERKKGSARTRWNHAVLKAVVAEKVLERAIDPETGALQVPVTQVLRDVLNVVGINYWKVTELRNLGLNPNLYCETQPGVSRIVVRPAGRPVLPDGGNDD